MQGGMIAGWLAAACRCWAESSAGKSEIKGRSPKIQPMIALAMDYFFIFLRTPAQPIRPTPRSNIEVGSGTGEPNVA